MEELLAKTTQLHVSDEEEWEIDKSLSSKIARFNLRGRLVSKADHSRGFLKKVLGRIWRLKETEWDVKIQDKHDTGMFLSFSFVSEQTQSRILAKMPWYLSNGLLILGKMVNTNESWKNDLTIFPIWGRILGVPTDLLTAKNTMRLASMAGAVISIQNSDVSRMVTNGFFRFQVWMSINKPVWPGYLLPCGDSKCWVACKYDELPFMCFRCGKIGHNQKECSLEYTEIEGADGVRAKAYGMWLKVDNEQRDGFHDSLKEPRMEVQQGIKDNQKISLPNQGLKVANSFTPLVDERETGKYVSHGNILLNNSEMIRGENSKTNEQCGAQTPTHETELRGNLERDEAQHKGKRRMVETQAGMGYGKLQKTDISTTDSLGQPQLFDVPIAFAKEGDNFYGGSSFNLGAGKHSISKEHRRKVAVKKDTKNRKSKVGTIPLLTEEGDWKTDMIHAYFHKDDIPWILGTPVDFQEEDVITWPLSSKGHYLYKGGSMFDFLVEIKHHLSIDEFEEVIKICWAIWENRNRLWNHLPTMKGERLIDWVLNSYPKPTTITVDHCSNISHQKDRVHGWQAPPEGVYCVYCDAALIPGRVGVGLGFIWTDWKAKIQAAGMCFLPHCSSVTCAEAEAILAALTSCPIDTNNQFEVRTDCKQLVDEFNGGSDSLTMDRSAINKIKRHQRFPRCTKLKFVYRKDNEIAHMLAKRSLEYHLTQSFLNSFPECGQLSVVNVNENPLLGYPQQ
ncbi:hypothetical protein G4B88_019436 [Cannabis sativa]|uniref:CCHC-type domain-containing protein n=1 Tax=Cannabis sativa TaxID=3483 RepID=A0A7J6HY74_CANSA|nr:hypothetical protein G4B88_019436 [Cannabis sativa]